MNTQTNEAEASASHEFSEDQKSTIFARGCHFAAGVSVALADKPRVLPSYFTAPRNHNAKAWHEGWDFGRQIALDRAKLKMPAAQDGAPQSAVSGDLDTANATVQQRVQVVKPGTKARFDLQRPYVLANFIPYAAAVPGTDMGEQQAGDRYWKSGHAWGWNWSEATRYSEEGATLERKRLIDCGCGHVKLVDANVIEARLQVMMAIRRAMEEQLPRAEFLAVCQRVRAVPDEEFARSVEDLAATGELTVASIVAASALAMA